MQVPAAGEEGPGTASPAEVERALVEWLRVELDDPEIVGSDNFLDIGGHSLTFSKLNAYLSGSFGTVLDMKTAYAEPLSVAVAKMQPSENR